MVVDTTESTSAWRPRLLSRENPPSRIYHYTTADGMQGILSSKTLWATDLEFLNDSREFVHGRDLVVSQVNSALKSMALLANSDGNSVRSIVWKSAESRSESLVAVLDSVLRSLRIRVSCFCSDGDLLSQWRGYGAGGYALGFDAQELRACMNQSCDMPLAKVVYAASDEVIPVEEEANGLAKWISERLDKLVERLEAHEELTRAEFDAIYNEVWTASTFSGRLQKILLQMLGVCIQIKDRTFSEEEWRCCEVTLVKPEMNVRFRSSRIGLIPYTALNLAGGDSVIPSLREVVIGPSAYPELRESSTSMFLTASGYEEGAVAIRHSKIPFRQF